MKPSYSMWTWATLTLAAALACVLAPAQVGALLGASAQQAAQVLVLCRLLGIVLLGYGAAYAVAAWSGERAFMQASVLLRLAILPTVLGMAALGWLPWTLLALGLLDLVGALWTRHELRQPLN